MSSIGTNLLFLHGHIHDPELARRLADVRSAPPPQRRSGKRQRTHPLLVALAMMLVVNGRDQSEHDVWVSERAAAAL